MNSDFTCDCGREIGEMECNECRSKELALLLFSGGTISPNIISHFIRDVKKTTNNLGGVGEVICPSCNENLITLCEKCYSSEVRKIIFSYFPREIYGKFANQKSFLLSQ